VRSSYARIFMKTNFYSIMETKRNYISCQDKSQYAQKKQYLCAIEAKLILDKIHKIFNLYRFAKIEIKNLY